MNKFLIISVHDVSPAFMDNIKVIFDSLNKLDVKRSLLIVPDFHSKHDIRKDKNFINLIKKEKKKGNELVLHGFYHISKKDFLTRFLYFTPKGVNEFKKINEKEAEKLLKEGSSIMKKLFGEKPKGFIAPNWSMNKKVKKLILKEGYYYTTRNSIVFPDKKIDSFVFGFSAGDNILLGFLIRLFCFFRLKLYHPRIIRFVIHPQEADIIQWEEKLLKGILRKGYTSITLSELRNYV